MAPSLESVLPPPPANVLDLGCGHGALCLTLAEQGYRCVGIDIAAGNVTLARKAAESRGLDVQFFAADIIQALHLVQGQQFDVIVLTEVLHMMPNWSEVLSECASCLPRAGTLIVEDSQIALCALQERLPDLEYFVTRHPYHAFKRK